MEQNSTVDNFDNLTLSSQAKTFLREIAKWANFLSIVGFIGIGLMVLAAITMLAFGTGSSFINNSLGSGFLGIGIAIMYLVFGLLYFIPIYYLNRFANHIKTALNTNDNLKLTKSFEYLKSHYKFIGIFTLIILAIYILIFGIAMVGAGFSAFN